MTIFAQQLNICSPKFSGYCAFHHHLATYSARVANGYVVLILLWQLQTRRQLKPATKR